MKLKKGDYSVNKICQILGENRKTFTSNQESFYNHLNMFFDCEFISKTKGISIQIIEDSDDFEYMKYKEIKKMRVREKYAAAAEEHLEQNPYNSARNLARLEKNKLLKEYNHSLKTGERYFGDELNRSGNWTKHLGDKKWVHLENGNQIDLTEDELKYLKLSFNKAFSDPNGNFIDTVLDAKEGIDIVSIAQMNELIDDCYTAAIEYFVEEYGFRPYRICKYDHEPLTEKDLELLQKKETKKIIRKAQKECEQVACSVKEQAQGAF